MLDFTGRHGGVISGIDCAEYPCLVHVVAAAPDGSAQLDPLRLVLDLRYPYRSSGEILFMTEARRTRGAGLWSFLAAGPIDAVVEARNAERMGQMGALFDVEAALIEAGAEPVLTSK